GEAPENSVPLSFRPLIVNLVPTTPPVNCDSKADSRRRLRGLLAASLQNPSCLPCKPALISPKMANQPPTRYKTDKRLWFLISLLLFAVPWFISKADCMRGNFKPASLFLELRNPPVATSDTLQLIGGFAL